MTTEIGKELRKLRIEHDERLLDMASRLEKSASFVSSVEIGKKSPPSGFEELVISAYSLAADAAAAMRRAADRSRRSFMLEPNSALGRDTAGLMARKINTLSEHDLQEIFQVLKRKGGPDERK